MRSRWKPPAVIRKPVTKLIAAAITFRIFAEGARREIYGRRIGQRGKEKVLKHFYLPGPAEGIFNSEPSPQSDEIVPCGESVPIDAVSFWCDGVRNVTRIWEPMG